MTIDNSINYNVGAAVALNSLNATASSLGRTQNYISTGKLINSADDNPSVWATATRTASDAGALDALLGALHEAGVVELECHPPSLESIFMSQYTSDGAQSP